MKISTESEKIWNEIRREKELAKDEYIKGLEKENEILRKLVERLMKENDISK